MRHTLLAPLALVGAACASGPSTPPGAPLIHVAGTYDTEVDLVEDSCGEIVVMPNPTTVAHEAGATRLSLTHAGATYAGTLNPDGTFQTDRRTVAQDDIGIAGRFSTTGFDATFTADRAGACRYVVLWMGTKRGPPNVIP